MGGKWNCEQKSVPSKDSSNTDSFWRCVCGHRNAKAHGFCVECAWEPTREYLENADILEMVRRMDEAAEHKQNETSNSNSSESKSTTHQNGNGKVVALGECGL